MGEKRGKILVLRGGAIGDFILTLPAIAALRGTFPSTHVEVLGYPVVAELARAARIIDGFRSIEARPLARFFARNAKLDEEWSDYFDSFNVIISYLYDPDDIFKTNVGRASKAQFIQGPHRPSESDATHATTVFLQPLEKLAIFEVDPVPKIELPAAAVRLAGDWVAVHPGSGSEKKNWPEKHWQELLKQIVNETSANILLIGGEAEVNRLSTLKTLLPPARSKLALNLPLSELAQLMNSANGFVGHDSGITHLAAALGLPVLILWGPSNEQIWRPLNSGVKIMREPAGLESLSPGRVFQELVESKVIGA